MIDLRFDHLREVNVARCVEGWKHPLDGWSLDDWMVATLGELGEASNVLKKLNRARDGITGNSKNVDELRAALGSELSDTVIYLDLTAASQNLALIGAGSFNSLFLDAARQTPSRMMKFAMRNLSKADEAMDSMAWWRGRQEDKMLAARGDAIEHVEHVTLYLSAIARDHGIALGDAVIRTFNAKSVELGMPHRLVPS